MDENTAGTLAMIWFESHSAHARAERMTDDDPPGGITGMFRTYHIEQIT